MNSMIALLRSTTKYGEVKITAWRRLLLAAYLAPNINTLMERLARVAAIFYKKAAALCL